MKIPQHVLCVNGGQAACVYSQYVHNAQRLCVTHKNWFVRLQQHQIRYAEMTQVTFRHYRSCMAASCDWPQISHSLSKTAKRPLEI